MNLFENSRIGQGAHSLFTLQETEFALSELKFGASVCFSRLAASCPGIHSEPCMQGFALASGLKACRAEPRAILFLYKTRATFSHETTLHAPRSQ